jgi:hypothetical protein
MGVFPVSREKPTTTTTTTTTTSTRGTLSRIQAIQEMGRLMHGRPLKSIPGARVGVINATELQIRPICFL